MSTDRQRLETLETHAAMQVSSVHGYLTAGEARELEHLRRKVGEQFDAVNRQWLPLR